MKMWGVSTIYRYVGSVLEQQSRGKGPTHVPPIEIVNETIAIPPPPADPRTKDDSAETYTMIVIFLSTLLPMMCVIISALLARKLWVKFHDPGPSSVEREDTTQTSIKSARESSLRKSSRAGSRVSKSEPSSRDKLLPQLLEEELERRPSIISSRRRSSSYFVFQDMDEEPSYENRSYANSPMPQEGSIDAPLEDPIIVVAGDEIIAGTSEERMGNSTTINMEDDGGFGGAKSKFRHSLKVDVEGSPHKTSHHRSYSDAGRNRRKSEQHHPEAIKEPEKVSKPAGNLLSAPGTKIRKSHSMRYRSDGSPTGSRPRSQAQDDCMGNLKRTALDPEIMVTSPRLSTKRSPHHLYQQQHQPQVHQQSHTGHHQHHYKTHHRQDGEEQQNVQLDDNVPVHPDLPVDRDAADVADFGMPTSDLSLEENGTTNSSYKYGNQPPNKYPPLNKVMYYGGYHGYPASSTGQTSTDMRPRRLHVSPHQGPGTSPSEEDENKEMSDRKKSLPNALDFLTPEIRPMPVLSPRGLLSKQFSLPAGARNSRQLKGGHQRHHASLRHDPAPQRLLEAPALTRRASARERSSSGGASSSGFLSARRTASGGGDRTIGRHSGSINLGSVSPRSPLPPNLAGAISPRNHLSISRPGQSPSPHHLTEDDIQHM